MVYVMSDLHGCFRQYQKMLEKIGFCDKDQLYVLGDVVDRGRDGIKLLQDMMQRKNVKLLMGNHDQTACALLRLLSGPDRKVKADDLDVLVKMWFKDGGYSTYEAFKRLPASEQEELLRFMNRMSAFHLIKVGGKKFFLAHTVPGKEKFLACVTCTSEDYVWGRPEYDREYSDNLIIVTGHTPTGLIDPKYNGRIYRRNGHIAVDCGVAFGNPLGCICLNTMDEFYVK